MSPEEAKSAYTAGFCDAEGGVNAPAVASHMAMLEAMKNNIDIKGEYSRIQTEMTKKYLDAMKGNPDLAQAYYETVMEFLNSSEFGEAQDISGQNDTSIYTNAEGKIVIVNVQNKDGAAATLMQLSTINNDGVVVTQKIDGKTCTQVRLFKTPSVDAPAPETPQAAPAPEVPKADTPAPTPNKPNRPKPPVTVTEAPPEEFTYTTSVCAELLPNGEERHEEFTGTGTTEDEAKADADRQANNARRDCTPKGTTTSTSTTTTAPTTTTGTSTTLPPIEVTTTTGVTVSTAPPTTPSTAPPTTPSTAPPTTPSTAPPPTTSPPPPPTTRPPVTEPPKTCESNPELCPTTTVPATIPEGPTETRPPATVLGFARSKFDSARTKADAKLGKLVTDAVQAGLGRLGNAAERANRANRANR